MSIYMHQFTLTKESIKSFLSQPQNRKPAVEKLFEAAGGKCLEYFFSFGDFDVLIISEFPNEIDALAASMIINSSGTVSKVKTTTLLNIEDAMQAMEKGGTLVGTYAPPSS